MIDPTTGSVGQFTGSAAGSQNDQNEALRGLDVSEFLNLMITELQNQDPLNPLENSEILQQISQIREIDSTLKLTKTLDAVLLGQNLNSASALIGKGIRGLSSEGTPVTGVVERVTVTDGVPSLHVGQHRVKLNNVGEILPSDAAIDGADSEDSAAVDDVEATEAAA
jgi:flagellar basal-body rod modification protein FlgD